MIYCLGLDIHVTQFHESYDGSQSGGSEYDSADELGDVEGNTCSLKCTLHGCREMISTGGVRGESLYITIYDVEMTNNYDTMTWETRSVLIDRRSKKISCALINLLGIVCKSAFSLCFQSTHGRKCSLVTCISGELLTEDEFSSSDDSGESDFASGLWNG